MLTCGYPYETSTSSISYAVGCRCSRIWLLVSTQEFVHSVDMCVWHSFWSMLIEIGRQDFKWHHVMRFIWKKCSCSPGAQAPCFALDLGSSSSELRPPFTASAFLSCGSVLSRMHYVHAIDESHNVGSVQREFWFY